VLFDAGHTLLEPDYPALTAQIRARGHRIGEAAVIEAERRARARLEREHAARGTRERRGQGRYLRYLLDGLGIGGEDEHRALTEWRRGFNPPVGLCWRADPQAAGALERVRATGLVAGVISNSNGSARLALERAGLVALLDFVIDSTLVGVAKPDPRVFQLGLRAAGVAPHHAVYVGDSYFVDVLGARRAGMGAVLFDPGGVWEERDCPAAAGLGEALDLALGSRA
jgi:FMN phosphatase YigB (HAD superfamily)